MDLKPPSIQDVLSSSLFPPAQDKIAAVSGLPQFEFFKRAYYPDPDQEQSYTHGLAPAMIAGGALGFSNAAHNELGRREFLRNLAVGRVLENKRNFEKSFAEEIAQKGPSLFTPEAQDFSRQLMHYQHEAPLRTLENKMPANLGSSALTALKQPGTFGRMALGAGLGGLGAYLFNRMSDRSVPADY